MNEPGSASGTMESPILALLVKYHTAIRRAESLPPIVWLHSRPPRLSATSRLKLPRLTLGASTLVRHHVLRSVDALLRDYAARAALGELDATGARERAALADFRASVQPVPWRRIIVAFVLAALLLGRGMIELLLGSLPGLASELTESDLNQAARVRATADALLALSSSFSASSVSVTASQVAEAGAGALTILAAGLVASAYLVLRPFSSAFRIKRMLFNLASTHELDLRDTCTTWHVSRSTGLYETERRTLQDIDLPPEKPFDLILSFTVATLLLAAMTYAMITDSTLDTYTVVFLASVMLLPGVLRLGWLACTYRDRQRKGTVKLPEYWRLPATGGLVDQRPVTESMAWSFLPYLAPVIWFRLARQTDRLVFEDATRQPSMPRIRGPWLALGSAVLLWLFPPAALFVRGLRVRRKATFAKSGLAIAAAVVLTIAYVSAFFISYMAPVGSVAESLFLVVAFTASAICVGVAQALANRSLEPLRPHSASQPILDHPPDGRLTFAPPPDWPDPPDGWSPPAHWTPDSTFPPAPQGWRFWVLLSN